MSTCPKNLIGLLSVAALGLAALCAGCPGGITGLPTTEPGGNGSTGGDDGNQPADANQPDDANQPSDANQPADDQFKLTIEITGSGSVDPPGGAYDAGAQVKLTALASSGWRFDRWEGDLTGSTNPATVTVSKAMAITAVFVSEAAAAFEFYAVYDRIVQTDQLPAGDAVGRAAMSADAAKVFFSNGRGDKSRKAFALSADGSGLTAYNLPDGAGIAEQIAVDEDGSRAYFASLYDRKIFKLEGGAVATISVEVADGPDWVQDLQTTSDGGTLFFREYSGDVWRVAQDGSGLTKIINDAAVPCVDGTAAGIGNMAVSADGGAIAFVMTVVRQVNGNEVRDLEIFVWQGGQLQELTVDREGLYCKNKVAISGGGRTIVYQDFQDDKFYAIDADGTDSRALEYAGFNFGGMALTRDGTQLFYSDANSEGGRLVQTDGSGALNLFPSWNVGAIAIGVTFDVGISHDGQHVFFRMETSSFPFTHALYVGHLNDVDALSDAPRIEALGFSPATMPRGDPSARVALAVTASDPGGLSDITNVTTDELVNGKFEGLKANLPAYFYFDPHDDGVAPDQAAGDGLFTTSGEPGGKANDFDALRMRVGAQDKSKTVVVADTILGIGP